MKTAFELIEEHGLTLHGDIEHFAELVRAEEREALEWALVNLPPAQRTWVGLTDEEAFQICVDCGCLSEDWLTLLDAIEAKLKEKNT